jgi:hypothetical protein
LLCDLVSHSFLSFSGVPLYRCARFVLGTRSLSHIRYVNIFSQSFHPLNKTFCSANALHFDEVQFLNFSFVGCDFGVMSKNSSLNPRS